MDVGTAFEMGYITALKKPIWGYSLDGRLYSDRIEGTSIDVDGFTIESFAMADNLMMVGAADQLGGLLTETLPENMENHLHLFEQILKQIKN